VIRISKRRACSRGSRLWMGLVVAGCVRAPRDAPQQPSELAAVIQRTWDWNDPAASEARFRNLAGGTTQPDRAQLETQIARALGLQGRFSDALAVLDALEPHLDSYPAVVRVRWLLERGRCLRSSGSAPAAQPLFLEAWARARTSGLDPLAIDAAHMVALTMDRAEALAWNRRALDLAETSADPLARRWRTSIHNNLGWTYHDAGDYDQALASFERALESSRELGDPEVTRIAEWSIGRALRSQARYSEALAIQRRLEAQQMPVTDGYVLEEIAENLLALGQADQARPYFGKAFTLLSADHDLTVSEPARIERLHHLGGTANEDHDD